MVCVFATAPVTENYPRSMRGKAHSELEYLAALESYFAFLP